MSKHLERELETLKSNILTMGTAVEDAIETAFKSVSSRDCALADLVIKDDAKIDEWEIEIEEECIKMLALYRPEGDDLRFIIVALKMNAELERIADLAANMAGLCKFLVRQPDLKLPSHLAEMADIAEDSVEKIIRSLIQGDTKAALDVIEYERKADELHVKTYELAERAMEKDSARAKIWLNFVSISKQLERISDHAMNMAEDVIYLLTGEIVRHRVGEFIAKGGASGKTKKS